MRRHWILRVLKFVLIAAALVAAVSFVVMSLWNWLMPSLFAWHTIGYWQAVGILILSKILFGGFRGGRPWHWRHRLLERMEQMTPEQAEKFRQEIGRRCGPFRQAAAEPKLETLPKPPIG